MLYLPPSLRGFAPAYMTFSTWTDHLPFAYDLVAAIRPRLLVELGTQAGQSYFTFCQSMKDHAVDGLAYAVDTFEGDAHTGADEKSLYERVLKYNRENYHGFSYLMRMLFQEAVRHFDDGTIDLLHIDGLHTYEAVREDFETWYPKVRPGGIILFHDVRARLMDFGAWKFWDELEAGTHGAHETFVFNQGFGLGVLRKAGGAREADAEILRLMFAPDGPEAGERLRSFYAHASKFHELSRQAAAQARRAEAKRLADAQAAQGTSRAGGPG
jgi:hypothetical protein